MYLTDISNISENNIKISIILKSQNKKSYANALISKMRTLHGMYDCFYSNK